MGRAAPVSSSSYFQYEGGSTTRDEPFLVDCGEDDWRSIVARCEHRRFRAGERVIAAGQDDVSLVIVLEGELHTLVGTGRRARTLTVSTAGSVVGELGFLDGLPRSADVVAATAGELLRLSRTDFESLAAAEPVLGRKILGDLGRIVALRVRRLTERVVQGG